MATLARSAPLPGSGTPVEAPQFQDIVLSSRSLVQKILLSVPDTHKSCIHLETLQLNSSEIAKYATMAALIGIPPAPVLSVVSENVTLESSLRRMHEGLLLHRNLLSSISPRLESKEKVTGLMADIRDLALQITKMLKLAQVEAVVQPTPTPPVLKMGGDFEVQVAAHVTLVQLQSFGQDMVRCLRSLERINEEDTES